MGQKTCCIFFTQSNQPLYNLFALAKENLTYMYNCLFNNIDVNFIGRFLGFIVDKIMPITKNVEFYFEDLKDYDLRKGCRVWREIDSFYENIIAMDTSINKMIYQCNLDKKEVLLYGIRYGSLELPIIAAMLLEVKYKYFNIKYSTGALCLKSNYTKNHNEVLNTKRELSAVNRRKVSADEYFHVLMDDNLVTGRTLQIAVNMLVKS